MREVTARDATRVAPPLWLDAYPALGGSPPSLLDDIQRQSPRLEVGAGQRLFDDGDTAQAFPLLLAGRVRVSKNGPDGTEVLLYRLRPGESCALTVTTLLGEDAYPATGTTESPVVFHALPRPLFLRLVLEVASFRTFVFHGLSERLAHLMTVVEDVTFRGMAQRVAAHLLEHPRLVDTTHQMLADDLGTRREVVSRILKTLQQAGYIRLGRRCIDVVGREALVRFRATGDPARGNVRKVTDTESTAV